MARTRRWAGALSAFLTASLLASGCSVRRVAVQSLANALAAGGDTYATDDDPELVAAAIPFGLKTMEALLAEAPEHDGLLLAASSGFTQYAFAFVQGEADLVEEKDLAAYAEDIQRLLIRNALNKLFGVAEKEGGG